MQIEKYVGQLQAFVLLFQVDFGPKGKKFSVNPQDTEFIHQIL